MSANVPQVLAEDETSYTIANPSGGDPVRVAKTPATIAMMKSSAAPAAAPATPAAPPPRYVIEPGTGITVDAETGAPLPQGPRPTNPVFDALKGAFHKITDDSPEQIAAKAEGNKTAAALGQPLPFPEVSAPGAPSAQAEPPAPKEEQKPADPKDFYYHPAGTAPAGTTIVGGLGTMPGMKDYISGVTASGEAQAKGARETAETLAQGRKVLADNDREGEAEQRANQTEYDAAVKDRDAYHIDRGAFWKSRTSGQKLLAGISVALGAMGEAWTHQQGNPGLQMLEEAINRNIADQQDALSQKNARVEGIEKRGDHLQRVRDLRGAKLWQLVELKGKEIAARTDDPVMRANAQTLVGSAKMKGAEFLDALAARQAAKAGAGAPKPQEAQALAEIDSAITNLQKYGGFPTDASGKALPNDLESAPVGSGIANSMGFKTDAGASFERVALALARAKHPGRPVSPEFVELAKRQLPGLMTNPSTRKILVQKAIDDLLLDKANIKKYGVPGSAAAQPTPDFTEGR